MNFEGLKLAPELLRALADCGYTEPTPIQAQTIPPLLEGRDVIGSAQTGTGKTAAFVLPALQRLATMTPARRRASRHRPSPRPGAGADSRARAAGGHAVRPVRQVHEVEDRVHLRRRAVSGAEPRALARRRHSGRHAGQADRPSRARTRRPVAARNAGAGRSRQDARYGLHRRRGIDRGPHAQDAADGAFLGDVRLGDRTTCRTAAARSGAHRGRCRQDTAARDRAARAFHRRPRPQESRARLPAG